MFKVLTVNIFSTPAPLEAELTDFAGPNLLNVSSKDGEEKTFKNKLNYL
jgi:hypothetical protein